MHSHSRRGIYEIQPDEEVGTIRRRSESILHTPSIEYATTTSRGTNSPVLYLTPHSVEPSLHSGRNSAVDDLVIAPQIQHQQQQRQQNSASPIRAVTPMDVVEETAADDGAAESRIQFSSVATHDDNRVAVGRQPWQSARIHSGGRGDFIEHISASVPARGSETGRSASRGDTAERRQFASVAGRTNSNYENSECGSEENEVPMMSDVVPHEFWEQHSGSPGSRASTKRPGSGERTRQPTETANAAAESEQRPSAKHNTDASAIQVYCARLLFCVMAALSLAGFSAIVVGIVIMVGDRSRVHPVAQTFKTFAVAFAYDVAPRLRTANVTMNGFPLRASRDLQEVNVAVRNMHPVDGFDPAVDVARSVLWHSAMKFSTEPLEITMQQSILNTTMNTSTNPPAPPMRFFVTSRRRVAEDIICKCVAASHLRLPRPGSYPPFVREPHIDEKGPCTCDEAVFRRNCVSAHGISASFATWGSSCAHDQVCGQCVYYQELKEPCLVVKLNRGDTAAAIPSDTWSASPTRASCHYPFRAVDHVYQDATTLFKPTNPIEINVKLMEENDPDIVLQVLTNGTRNFGVSVDDQWNVGLVLVVIGGTVVVVVGIVVMCGCGWPREAAALWHLARGKTLLGGKPRRPHPPSAGRRVPTRPLPAAQPSSPRHSGNFSVLVVNDPFAVHTPAHTVQVSPSRVRDESAASARPPVNPMAGVGLPAPAYLTTPGARQYAAQRVVVDENPVAGANPTSPLRLDRSGRMDDDHRNPLGGNMLTPPAGRTQPRRSYYSDGSQWEYAVK